MVSQSSEFSTWNVYKSFLYINELSFTEEIMQWNLDRIHTKIQMFKYTRTHMFTHMYTSTHTPAHAYTHLCMHIQFMHVHTIHARTYLTPTHTSNIHTYSYTHTLPRSHNPIYPRRTRVHTWIHTIIPYPSHTLKYIRITQAFTHSLFIKNGNAAPFSMNNDDWLIGRSSMQIFLFPQKGSFSPASRGSHM